MHLVLIAAPGQLNDADAEEARVLLARGHRRRNDPSNPIWLSQGEACEIDLSPVSDFETGETRAWVEREIMNGLFAGRPIDAALVSRHHRRKKLLVADMESTIIAEECLDELAGIAGVREKIEAITAAAMRGELAFEGALRERVALLANLGENALARVLDRVTFVPGAQTLVKTMKKHGAFTALVSGGFSYFALPVAEKAGFDVWQANALALADGKLTGEVEEPILGREAKRKALLAHRTRLGLSEAETLAVGDGANDIAMIEAAGLGVAFRAKTALEEKARVRIRHGDLTALLYLQGYRREEFAK